MDIDIKKTTNSNKSESKYDVASILTSNKYQSDKLLLVTLLDAKKRYTNTEISKLLNDFRGRRVH